MAAAVVGAGWALGLGVGSAIAEAGQSTQDNVLASTRNGQPIDAQAVPVSVIGREQIDAQAPKMPGDIAHLFDNVAGLRSQTTSPTLGTTMMRVRGLPGHYTRMLADGVTLYGDRPGGHAPLRIPTLDVGRVEIIKEPASALFGSDAVAVINLVSRRPASEPSREFLFNQSLQGATDALLWISSPPTGNWSSTFLFSGHHQEETDVDDDGWSDLPGFDRAVAHPRVSWNNKQGKAVTGVAEVAFEKREGGSATVREALETKTAAGSMSGQMPMWTNYILAGAGTLHVQSRTRDFPQEREGDRFQTATIEITLQRPGTRHTWLAGIAADWYALRSPQDLATEYVSTRPGLFVHDDMIVAPWLAVSGSMRLDYHNLYSFLLSPRGSALVHRGEWAARFSASQGYFTPRPFTEETEAAGLARLTIVEPLEKETARSFSGDLMHKTSATSVTLSVFRSQIDNPGQVDRATYTLRTESEPIVSQGVEVLGTARRGVLSVGASYAHVETRERGDLDLPLSPRHRASFLAAAESAARGRVGLDVSFTGEQRLERNPYRSTSASYVVVNLVGEYRFGRWRAFVNADNLTDVMQTDWDPIARPSPDIDGRWTVDAWAPLAGRLINAGIRVSF